MKFKHFIIVSIGLLASTLISCTSTISDYMGNWVNKGSFDGKPRAEGTSFAINNYGYFGMGRDDDEYLSDFWKYDPVKNSWSQVADFPGTPRAYGTSVSNGTYGFAGLGYDGDDDLSDFWRYDPVNNEWSQLPDFKGGTRRYPTSFAIGDDIYVGTGTQDDDNFLFNDFWKFDGESWTSITSIWEKRRKAISVTLNGKAYVMGGYHNNTLNDFWRYDPTTDSWEELKDLDEEDHGSSEIPRMNAVSFAVEGKIYLVAGNTTGSSTVSTCFEWDPDFPEWIRKTSLSGSNREGAGSFVLNGYGYIVGGRNGTSSSSYKDDIYMFQPNVEDDDDDN